MTSPPAQLHAPSPSLHASMTYAIQCIRGSFERLDARSKDLSFSV